MKFKFDENLPDSLRQIFTSRGLESCSVQSQGMSGAKDSVVWERVQREGYFLVTQDLDFSDTRKFRPGTHHGILLLRLKAPGRSSIREKILTLLESENPEDWSGCFVVVSDSKIRIQRPAR